MSTFYPAKWRNANGGDTTPDWHFMMSVPPGGFRDRVNQGLAQWNAQYQAFSFIGPLAGDYGDWADPCARPPFNGNGVRFVPIDGPGAGTISAWADVCPRMFDHWQYTNFLITFDSAEVWNTTTNLTPDNSGILDLWGTAAHESGHATGWGTRFGQAHFFDYDTSTCAPYTRSDVHTMCPWTVQGSDRERTLEYHDYEVFRAAY